MVREKFYLRLSGGPQMVRCLSFVTVVIMILGFTPLGARATENGAGIRLTSISAETWSAGGSEVASGVYLETAGAFDESLDSGLGSGILLYLGILDPIPALPDETPTSTPFPSLTWTLTPTGTLTLVAIKTPTTTSTVISGPTFTPTVCEGAVGPDDFDLDGDSSVDAVDLFLLLERMKYSSGPLYDFDCNGQTDGRDLALFAIWWNEDKTP